ncbi:MAG: SpoVR family protein [candidate division Zixibacteria bacterium]|nr:SpoVR family protein [candidate division Zixibacteria bacterium]
MYLVDQHLKAIMEECKARARDAGLNFGEETLEYIVTNRDLIELSPKLMIPTMYDYWVHDVEVLKGQGRYKVYPTNPYETVINSRPAISFYNDNNPDWLNIMIFYHVLAHIDFFQNNTYFEKTWDDDFVGQALADKRMIVNLRSEHGRWVDYVIEFSRSINNLTGYYQELAKSNLPSERIVSDKIEFYFGTFLQDIKKLPSHEIFEEIEKYNKMNAENEDADGNAFFYEVQKKYPEFNAVHKRQKEKEAKPHTSLMEFIRDNSSFLKQEDNAWMKSIMDIVRYTSLYFDPQIRTKILNEGWASYWHDQLFRIDDRITGHEVDYAKTNAGVTSLSRIGLNPYAIGLRLLQHIEELTDKGKLDYNFQKIDDIELRNAYDKHTGGGKRAIFDIRSKFSDYTLINTFVSQDFIDKYDLFVVGMRRNEERGTVEYYVKSRKVEDYKKMLIDSLYHPPKVEIDKDKTDDSNLYLTHRFEGKQLVKDYIPDTMIGIEYLWGGQVQLETTEIIRKRPESEDAEQEFEHKRVLYTIKDRKITKKDM